MADKKFQNDENKQANSPVESGKNGFSFRSFWSRYKKSIGKIAILFGILIVISFGVCATLFATGIVTWDANGIGFDKEAFTDFSSQYVWTYFAFLALQVVFSILLSFVPGASMAFIVLGSMLFVKEGDPTSLWIYFAVAFSGVVISSLLMDLIGRFGGVKLVTWLVGEKDYQNALHLVETKKYSYLPFMYLLPIFPDDALCMVAGLTKIKLWYHALIIVICRGIGVATIVFVIDLIPYEHFSVIYNGNAFYGWFLLIAAIIVYVFVLLKIANLIDKQLQKWFDAWGKSHPEKSDATPVDQIPEDKNK